MNNTIKKSLQCNICNKTYTRSDNLRRHLNTPGVHQVQAKGIYEQIFISFMYFFSFTSVITFVNNIPLSGSIARLANTKKCSKCNIFIPRNKFVGHLRTLQHKIKCVRETKFPFIKYVKVNSAFKSRISQHQFYGRKRYIDFETYSSKIIPHIEELILLNLEKFNAIKVGFELISTYLNPTVQQANESLHDTEKILDERDKNVILKAEIITLSTNLPKYLKRIQEKLNTIISEDHHEQSGWLLKHHKYIEMTISLHNPLRMTIGSYIKLPSWIVRKHCTITIKSLIEPNKCFKSAIIKGFEHILLKFNTNPTKIEKKLAKLDFRGKTDL